MASSSRAIVALLPLLCACVSALRVDPVAVRPAPQVLDTPEGTVEVIGLKRWTAAMLRDSVQARQPGTSLFSGACMVVIRDSLGFADALSALWIGRGPSGERVEQRVITVLEPQDSARVRFRAASGRALPLRAEWREAILPFVEPDSTFFVGGFLGALQGYEHVLRGRPAAPGGDGPGGSEAARLDSFLAGRRAEQDFRLALWTLERDGNALNRLAASAILANFAGREDAWRALAEALRDPDERVRTAAGEVLAVFLRTGPREVDWAPAAESIHHLLSGTNLPAYRSVLEVLARTGVSPAVARRMLRGSAGELLLAHLQARHEPSRRAAHAFLVQASGGLDHGYDAHAWAGWMDLR